MNNYETLKGFPIILIQVLLYFIFLGIPIFVIITKIRKNKKKKDLWIFKYMWDIVFISIIIFISLIFYTLLVYTFNSGKWLYFCNKTILTNMESWGGFATCFASLFTLISVYWMYKAFTVQANTSKRASFDATFTQIFTQHHILYEKVNRPNSNFCCFSRFRLFFKEKLETNCKISIIWENYNICLALCYGEDYPSNFKNYFKYIHREVTFVQENFKDTYNIELKKRYVRLIEGQMNNDELFAYFVNQLEYCERHWMKKEKELKNYLLFLKENDFFKEICEENSAGYCNDVIKALELFNEHNKTNINEYIIKEEWLPSTK